MDPTFLPAVRLAELTRRREIGCLELLDHYIARVARLDGPINAVVVHDFDRARDRAHALDQSTDRSAPLFGVPMTVKESFDVAGLPSTRGHLAAKDHRAEHSSIAVRRLEAAGVVIFGKTNVPVDLADWQSYNPVYGTTTNPWNRDHTPGGSSGGSAAALAAGMTGLEMGSDIGGSIRNPAHYNGIYGLKPSWGVVPSRGHIPGPPGSLVETDVNCGGPLARSLEDLRTALTVVAGPVPEDAAAWHLHLDPGPEIDNMTSVRVATVFAEGSDLLPVARDVRASLDGFASGLAGAGVQVDAVPLPVPLADGLRSWQELVLPIIGTGLSDQDFAAFAELEAVPGDDPMLTVGRALASRYRSWARANANRQRQRAAWATLFQHYEVVLAPVMPTTAFPHDTDRPITDRVLDIDGTAVPHLIAMAWCGAIGPVLLPVVTLPIGPTSAGLPVGIQVIGPYLSDLRLLQIAELLEAAAGTAFTPPPD